LRIGAEDGGKRRMRDGVEERPEVFRGDGTELAGARRLAVAVFYLGRSALGGCLADIGE
jgi:hypothetical protein